MRSHRFSTHRCRILENSLNAFPLRNKCWLDNCSKRLLKFTAALLARQTNIPAAFKKIPSPILCNQCTIKHPRMHIATHSSCHSQSEIYHSIIGAKRNAPSSQLVGARMHLNQKLCVFQFGWSICYVHTLAVVARCSSLVFAFSCALC